MEVDLSGTEVEELIGIVDDKTKIKRGHWYTLGIPTFHHYLFNLDEQLDAIRKLGSSKNKRALDYLRLLQIEESVTEGTNIADHDSDFGYSYHPHAKGELGNALLYHWANTEAPMNVRTDEEPDRRAIDILESAISQLEKSLQ